MPGGLPRRASFIKSSLGDEVIVLDAGNVFGYTGFGHGQIKAEIAVEGMEIMSYNIFNFGNKDFLFGTDFLLNYTNQFNVPTINANVVYEDTGENITTPNKIMQFGNLKVGIIGIVSQEYADEILRSTNLNFPDSRRIIVLDETIALQTEIDNIKNNVDAVIVLAHVGMDNSIAIAEAIEGIDVIIIGNGDEIVSLLTTNGVYIVKAGRQGQNVGNLVLRFDENNNLYDAEGSMVYLDDSIDDDAEMLELMFDYHDRLEAAKDELLNIEQVDPDSGGYYIGYSLCSICHSAQTDQWNTTDHATAFMTVIEMGNEYNSECFYCHTNGYGYTGGFVMSDTTPEMEGVQCEMCHGAGVEHSVSESVPFGQTSESTCTAKCHNQDRDPNFNYATYYPRVIHSHPPDDYDNDGTNDNVDNCPNAYNPDQVNFDNDSFGNVCDNCSDVENEDQADSDGDDVGNACDNCPSKTNPGQEDTFPPQGNNIGDACECEPDFGCDGDVDGTDATTFKLYFGRNLLFYPCDAVNPCRGDFDCDHDCDGTDASLFKSDFGRSEFHNSCPACEVNDWCLY